MAGGFEGLLDDLVVLHRLRAVDRVAAVSDHARPHQIRKAMVGDDSNFGYRAPSAVQHRHSSQQAGRDLERLGKSLDATVAALPVHTQVRSRADQIAHVRNVATASLDVAMKAFYSGQFTADEVCRLEILCGNMVQHFVDTAA